MICRKLRLQPGETVVETGCGWGALAIYMAQRYGVRVKAFNISHEQIVYAREWAKREGVTGSVEFIEDDYRNVSQQFDVFCSVGMLEHVGLDHYRDLGRVITRHNRRHRARLPALHRPQPSPVPSMRGSANASSPAPTPRRCVESMERTRTGWSSAFSM